MNAATAVTAVIGKARECETQLEPVYAIPGGEPMFEARAEFWNLLRKEIDVLMERYSPVNK